MKMRCSIEPRFRKYVNGYVFFSFARKFGDKYGKKLKDTATKTVMDVAKTASKTVVQKTAEATGDLIGNRIADKNTLIGKPKEKEKTKKIEEIYIPPEKRQQVSEHKFCFLCIKMEFQKITNFLDTTFDNKDLQRFVTKKWIEVYDQSEETYDVNKKNRIKISMLRSDLCDCSDAYIVVKGDIITDPNDAKRNNVVAFKNNAPFID